ncbi:C2H2 type zinc finger domain-containing protein, partial [Fusarium phyllophilum]
MVATEPSQTAPFIPMPKDILDFDPLHGTFPQMRSDHGGESSWCYPQMTCQDSSHSEWPTDGTTNYVNIFSSEYAFRQSLWSWTIREGEHWRSETTELIPWLDDQVSDFVAQNPQTCASTPLLASTRHRLISMLLSVSSTGDYERIMSTFPSLTTLDYLLSKDLQGHSKELDSWIHIATFDPNLACPELVLGLIISGAFRCNHPQLWKLGLAMLELHMELCLRIFSLALVTAPLVRSTEMSVPLPAARSLWNAPSAEAWRSAYLALDNQNLGSLPELRSCCSNFAALLHLSDAYDAPSTGLAILSGLWVNVWQYKERVNARNTSTEALHANSALIIESLQQEARGILEDFKNVYTQLTGTMEPNLLALHEHQLMHLYISLEDVQYLGGKAGETEARRVLPLLKSWVKGRASRQAAWHAGQILRVGRQELDSALRASMIMAIYHASLTIWAYSMLSDIPSLDMLVAISQRQLYPNQDHYTRSEPLALIDGGDTPLVQRFLLVPDAKAAITHPAQDMEPIMLHISRAPAVMTAIATLLRGD